jgi:hypothetical protein
VTKSLSPRGAIAAKCKSCIYDPISPGTWRAQVAECSSTNCPLHPFRPGPIAQKRANKAPTTAPPPETPGQVAGNADGSFFDRLGCKNDQ